MSKRICSVADCDKPYRVRDMCAAHYSRWLKLRNGGQHPTGRVCSVEGCDKPFRAHEMCRMHDTRRQREERRRGDPVEPLTLPGERWLPILGYEGFYEVSDGGRVRSVSRTIHYPSGRSAERNAIIIRPLRTPAGYITLGLSKHAKRRTRAVHVLVLEAFAGARPEGLECRHLNGKPSDNRISNLAWGSGSENTLDKIRHGTHTQAAMTHCGRGHLLQAPNLLCTNRTTKRVCMACHRARQYVRRWAQHDVHLDVQKVSDKNFAEIMNAAA